MSSPDGQLRARRRRYVRLVALVLVGLSAIAGAMIGSKVGVAVCSDASDAWFRCLDQGMLGMLVGFFVGGALGVAVALFILRAGRPQ